MNKHNFIKMVIKTLYGITIMLLFWACSRQEGTQEHGRTTSLGKIIYDTKISNPNPEDEWITKSLSGLKKDKLVKILFDEVYSGNLTPLEYFSGTPLSRKELKELEEDEEFSRDRIAQIKFDEEWLWDKDNQVLRKQVRAVTIAYEVYDNFGNVRGYKPAFKISFSGITK